MKMFRRVLAALTAAILFSGAAVAQSPIPYVTGPLNPADVVGNTNKLIQQLDAQFQASNMVQPVVSPRNLVIGGDFGTNLWQRGTAASANISTTCTYWADAWCAYAGTSGSANVTKETAAADIPTGSLGSLRLQRTSGNAILLPISENFIVDPQDVTPAVGNTVACQLSIRAGANFSGTSAFLNVITGTGVASNSTAANLVAASWTGQATTGAFTLPITSANTTFQTFGYGTGVTPLTVVIPTTATELAFQIGWTPIGTAGTNDWIEFTLVQCEVLPQSTTTASPYDHRVQALEGALEQRRAFVISEGTITAGAVMSPVGTAQGTTTTCTTMIPFPVTMRAAPTYTNALTASTFKIVSASQAATALGTPFSATLGANTPYNASINFTTTGMTAKDSCFLVSAAGSGLMVFTADF